VIFWKDKQNWQILGRLSEKKIKKTQVQKVRNEKGTLQLSQNKMISKVYTYSKRLENMDK
jgi:division protein CdvB (Snf7/Vps24/ESCRT-III family)